jgi:hypothetical protein
MMLSLDSGTVRPLLQTPFDEFDSVVSPDGRWIAYESDRSGQYHVHVSAFPSMTNAVQVSIEAAAEPSQPAWSADGRRLYFRRGQEVLAVEMPARLTDDLPLPVSVTTFPSVDPFGFVDPMPDGRLLGLDGRSIGVQPDLRVVLNWFTELP